MPNPRVRDSVWSSEHGNGIIRHIDYHDKEVVVFFHHTGVEETFEWDDFDYFYEAHNQWRIIR